MSRLVKSTTDLPITRGRLATTQKMEAVTAIIEPEVQMEGRIENGQVVLDVVAVEDTDRID
ncbi:hypothetical protein Syun_020528 [Stephania yunnanensis]|uniref:Uncharacterized protein n=1 Tax=Stephania yunnanensis TaxID=152371 RepID=A0AAP0IF96_9MAGN